MASASASLSSSKLIWGITGLVLGGFVVWGLSDVGRTSSASPMLSSPSEGSTFALLDQNIAYLEAEEFLERQEKARVFYRPLREQIEKEIAFHADTNISYYFEDLGTGAWTGVNERQGYIPASLAKIPTLAAVLKKLEITDTDGLNTKLMIGPEDFDPRSGIITKEMIGTEMELGKLAEIYLGASDNSAGWTLKKMLDVDDLIEARVAMGMPPLDTPGAEISPKIYGNVLRSLYRSTFLSRELSNFILSILLHSIYVEGIPAGVPKDVGVAHKVGAFSDLSAYHDCGIVYHSARPYIICVMTQKATLDNANGIISKLSQITYEYVNNPKTPLPE